MSTENKQTSIPKEERLNFKGEVHNYKNDYKFTFDLHQKANGEFQMGCKIRSDFDDNLTGLMMRLMTELRESANEKGFRIVKHVGAD